MLNSVLVKDNKLSLDEIQSYFGIDISNIETTVNNSVEAINTAEEFFDMIENRNFHELIFWLINHIKNVLLKDIVVSKEIMYTFVVLSFFCMISKTVSADDFKPDIKYINITAAGALLIIFSNMYAIVSKTIISAFEITKSIMPVYLGVSMVSGINPVMRSLVVLLVTGFQFLSSSILMPAIFMSMIICLMVAVSDIGKFRLNSVIISSVNWIIGLYTTFHLMFIKLIGMNTSIKTNLLFEGLRYTASKGVPVVGNYVSETLTAFITGLSSVNNYLGYTVTIITITSSIIPFIVTMLSGLALKMIGSIYYVFSDNSTYELINNVSACVIELGIILVLCVVGFVSSYSFMFV